MFGIVNYGALVAAFIVLLFLPGPGNLALITSTGKGGVAGGMAAVMGLLLGDQILMWLTVAGLAAVLASNPMLFRGLQYVGAAYLAWLGFKMLTAKTGDKPIVTIRPAHYFQQTLLITLFNPKTIMFYVAFFPQFIDPSAHQGFLTFAVLAATVALLGFIYCTGVVIITHTMAERIRANTTLTRGFQKIAGVFLVGFGIKLVISK